MNWDQLISGASLGLLAVLIAGIGRFIYVAGSNRMDTHNGDAVVRVVSKPFFKCVSEGLLIATFVAVLASTPSAIGDRDDPLYDSGEYVEHSQVERPQLSFARTFVFVSICWVCGAVRNDAE